jgi:hypothetical protein
MEGEQALGLELTAATNTTANGALVASMKTIRSDIIKALQCVDQQRPLPAEAEATAKAVAWLIKNKDQLLQVIHDLTSPKYEALPAAGKTMMDVIHAHPPPRRPLERRLTPAVASRIALMWLERVWLCVATLNLCAVHGVCSASSAAKTNANRNKWMTSCALPARTLARRLPQRGPGSCWYGTHRPRTRCSPEHAFCEGTMHALPFARFRMHWRRCGCSFAAGARRG